jgi:hypothetical protein
LLLNHTEVQDVSCQTTGTDNVWDVDCSSFFPPDLSTWLIHGAYFYHDGTLALMRQVLRGIDRGVLDTSSALHGESVAETSSCYRNHVDYE